MPKRHYQAYASAMQTMPGTRQVVLLYDTVIRCLQQAQDAMREKNIEARFANLTQAAEILFGLQSCLDFENGGEVARVLYNFYASADARIFGLHRSNDAAACEQLVIEIKQMRDVWDEIDRGAADGKPQNSGTGASPSPPGDTAVNVTLSA